MSQPIDPSLPGGEPTAQGNDASVEHRPRVTRPVPSQLFAQRSRGEGGADRPRTTRVVPALAAAANQPAPAAPTAAAAAERIGIPTPPAPDHAPEFPPDVVFIVRTGGAILYVNRPLGRRSEEEIVGTQFTDWVFPEQHATVREALARVFETGRSDGVELQGIQGHDADAWFECRIAANMRDSRVVSVTVIARDVTRYRQTERRLREQEDHLRRELSDRQADLALLREQLAQGPASATGDEAARQLWAALETAGEAMFLVDPANETLVDLNETACRWLRGHRRELRGRPVGTLDIGFPLLPPVNFDVQFTETRDTRRPLTLEGDHRRVDGSAFPVEVSVIRHEENGKELLLAIARDVKDRRRAQDAIAESEAQYRGLFEQSFDAIYLTTRGGEIVDANPAAVQLFGYRREEFIGLDARTVMPDVDDIRRFQRVMAAERFVARLEVTLRRWDGSAFPAVLSASRRRDAHDRLLGYQWVVRALENGTDAGVAAQAATLPERRAAAAEAARVSGEQVSGGVVLLVGDREAARREAGQALERAGFTVLQAADGAGAIRLLRTHDDAVQVAVVRGEGLATAEDVARDLQAIVHDLRIVLIRPGDAALTPPPDLDGTPVLRDPPHPLGLVQAVRETIEAGRK